MPENTVIQFAKLEDFIGELEERADDITPPCVVRVSSINYDIPLSTQYHITVRRYAILCQAQYQNGAIVQLAIHRASHQALQGDPLHSADQLIANKLEETHTAHLNYVYQLLTDWDFQPRPGRIITNVKTTQIESIHLDAFKPFYEKVQEARQ